MDELVEEAVEQVALEGEHGCTAQDLWIALDKHVLPTQHFERIDPHVAGAIWRNLKRRRDVVVAGECPESEGDWARANVKAMPEKREEILVGGRSSLLIQLSELEKECLAVVAKSRRSGVLQKDLPQLLNNKPATGVFPAIKSLQKLCLVAKHKVVSIGGKIKAEDSGRPSVRDKPQATSTNCIYLLKFAPKMVRNSEIVTAGEMGGIADEALPQMPQDDADHEEESTVSVSDLGVYFRQAVQLISGAPKKTLVSNELRRIMDIDKPLWGHIVKKLKALGIVEECVSYLSDKVSARCLQLKEGDDSVAITCTRPDEEPCDVNQRVGAHLYVESWPTHDMMELLSSCGDKGATSTELEEMCVINIKGMNRLIEPLQKENLLKRESFQKGKQMGWRYKKLINDDRTGSSSSASASQSTRVSRNDLKRQEFIVKALKERGFLLYSMLTQYTRLSGDDDKLFMDNKCTNRSLAALEKEGICHVDTVVLRRKTVLSAAEFKVILPADKFVDDELLQLIRDDVNKQKSTIYRREDSDLKQVDGVVKMTVDNRPPLDIVKSEDGSGNALSAAQRDAGYIPIRSSSDTRLRLHGLIRGKVARAKALHHYLWYKSKVQQSQNGTETLLDLNGAILDMPLESFARIAGVTHLSEDLLQHTALGTLPAHLRKLLLNKMAERRVNASIDLLCALGVIDQIIDTECNENQIKIRVLKSAHMVVHQAKVPPAETSVSIESFDDKHRIEFALDSQIRCNVYWDYLQRYFERSNHTQCKMQGLFPGNKAKLVCVEAMWIEGLASSDTLRLQNRSQLLSDIASDPSIIFDATHINKMMCKVLANRYRVDLAVVKEVAKLWLLDAEIKSRIEENPLKHLQVATSDGNSELISYRKRMNQEEKTAIKQERKRLRMLHTTDAKVHYPRLTRPIKRQRFSRYDDRMMLKAFAIAQLVDDDQKVQWSKRPSVPAHQHKSCIRRLQKFKKVKAIKIALDRVAEISSLSNDNCSSEQDLNQQEWTFPAELVKMCEEDEELKRFLKYQGLAFAKTWFESVKHLILVADRSVTKVKEPKQPKEVEEPESSSGVDLTSTLPSLAPLATRKRRRRRMSKAEDKKTRHSFYFAHSFDESIDSIPKAMITDAIVSYLTASTNSGTHDDTGHGDTGTETFCRFLSRFPEANVFEAVRGLKNSGLLQHSELAPFELSRKFHALLQSSMIPAGTLKEIRSRFQHMFIHSSGEVNIPQTAASSAVPGNAATAFSALDVLNILSLIFKGASPLQNKLEPSHQLSQDHTKKRIIQKCINSRMAVDCKDGRQMENEYKVKCDLLRNELSRGLELSSKGRRQAKSSLHSDLQKEVLGHLNKCAGDGATVKQITDAGLGEGESVELALEGLISQRKAMRVNTDTENYFVHAEHSAQYCHQHAGVSLPVRSWVAVSGDINEAMLDTIRSKVLSIVFCNPGIKFDSLAEQFHGVINPHSLEELVQALVASRLLSTTTSTQSDDLPDALKGLAPWKQNQTSVHYFTEALPHEFIGNA